VDGWATRKQTFARTPTTGLCQPIEQHLRPFQSTRLRGTSWRSLAFSDILPPEIDGSASAFVINK
jgi:hypothetical protein